MHISFLDQKLLARARLATRSNELLLKAIRHKTGQPQKILDVTAGLGRDAFLLAYQGHEVLMLERSKVIANALQSALQDYKTQLADISLHLKAISAFEYCPIKDNQFDCIICDPMHPPRRSKGVVKQNMRALRDIVGDDSDAEELITLLLQQPVKRIVIKYPRKALRWVMQKPSYQITGQSTRFDIYLLK